MEKKRLMIYDRINLQAAIKKGYSLKTCSFILKKSRSTIMRELKNNCTYRECTHFCSHCNKKCIGKIIMGDGECLNFEYKMCERWKVFPYTCNECSNSNNCRNLKRYYDCQETDEKSKRKRIEPRTYSKITKEMMLILDKELIIAIRKNGQSLHHYYMSSVIAKKICCERTIRRYIYKGYFTVKAHELPRYVRYSHKYEYKKKKLINIERMLNRTFADYLTYMAENPNINNWQYDSVLGTDGDKKCILTITFPKLRFQFGYLVTKFSWRSVYNHIRKLQEILGDKYSDIFQVNLSDNGIEFTKFHELEIVKDGIILTKTFFTNPYKATDKPHCERNHEFIRYIIPKGQSLDFLTQEKVNLMFSHINSYIRLSNNDKTPYELTLKLFGKEFMEAIGIKPIAAKDVCLKPSLVKPYK